MTSFFEKVYITVKRIPKGRLSTYSHIASICGNPRSARAVGWALRALNNPNDIPWYRVVSSKGYLTIIHPHTCAEHQKQLLEAENIPISWDSNVSMFVVDNLQKFIWKPN